MKRGEKVVLLLLGALVAAGIARSLLLKPAEHDSEIPFYSTASADVARAASDLVRANGCKSCHSLWTVRDLTQAVPAPMLDGIGSLRSEGWLYDYLSAPDPQQVLPSRLKARYRMPSYRSLAESDRRLLASYLASLKVKDWYLAETRNLERQKLTGQD